MELIHSYCLDLYYGSGLVLPPNLRSQFLTELFWECSRRVFSVSVRIRDLYRWPLHGFLTMTLSEYSTAISARSVGVLIFSSDITSAVDWELEIKYLSRMHQAFFLPDLCYQNETI